MSRRKGDPTDSRKLVDCLQGAEAFGQLRALLATTFDLGPEFFELDFLPSLYGLGAWDDRKWVSRIALERSLAHSDAVVVLMDAGRYQGRPRSLRVQVSPARGARGQKMHAKVLLLAFDEAVRLIVGSANLTEPGYRTNREVALCLTATRKRPQDAALIKQALGEMPGLLSPWWTDAVAKVSDTASQMLSDWAPAGGPAEEAFVWGGGSIPVWRSFLDRWPAGERVERLVVVSPFWSADTGQGPLATLLSTLAEKAVLASAPQVTLVTSAARDAAGVLRPTMPQGMSNFDGSRWNASVFAIAADPKVQADEAAGNEHVLRERALHAKVVLLAGPKSTLAYAGSANFSAHGWGFLGDPALANIEAGVVMLRSGRLRGTLEALVPPTSGERVRLGDGSGSVVVQAAPEPERLWPAFLRGVWLHPDPSDESLVAMRIEVEVPRVTGAFRVSLPDSKSKELLACDCGCPEGHQVALDASDVDVLLQHQHVLVSWWEVETAVEFPINATLSARDQLPISPGDGRPTEDMLVAYYQGRIAWEELFPEPEPSQPSDATSGVQEPSAVDVSKIQSYQVRSFVEALKGIQDDLSQAPVSETAIRLALHGPVSPVALARQIRKAVRVGQRSPTAGGFQLLELVSVIASARRLTVEDRVREVWESALAKARTDVQRLLDSIREQAPGDFNQPGFVSYQRMIRERCGSQGDGQ